MRRAAVTLALVLLAESASAQTTGYTLARRPRTSLIVTGGAMLVLGWIASIITAAADGFHGESPLVMIPVAGPFVGFGWDRANPSACPLDVDTSGCNAVLVDVGLFTVGLTELTGAVLLGVGLVPRDVHTSVTVSLTPFGVRGTF